METINQVITRAAKCNYQHDGDCRSDSNQRNALRARIHRRMVRKYGDAIKQFSKLTGDQVTRLYRYYDEVVFSGQLSRLLQEKNRTLVVQVTPGVERGKVGGWCRTTSTGHTISFPLTLYTKLFARGETSTRCGGLLAHDRLGALQLTMEHELVHLINQLSGKARKKALDPTQTFTSHGKLFRYLVYHYFGHTEHHHEMGLQGDPALRSKLTDFAVGDLVEVDSRGSGGRYQARVAELHKKNITVQRVSDRHSIRVSPILLRKVVPLEEPTPAVSSTTEFHVATGAEQTISVLERSTRYAKGDYVKVKAGYVARVERVLVRNCRVKRRADGLVFVVSHAMLVKISPEQYNDPLAQGAPIRLASDFTAGDYVKMPHNGETVYGQVLQRHVKNITARFFVRGKTLVMRGRPSVLSIIDKGEYEAGLS